MQRVLGRVAAGAAATVLAATTMAAVTTGAVITGHGGPARSTSTHGANVLALTDFAAAGSGMGVPAVGQPARQKPSHGPHASPSPTPSPSSTATAPPSSPYAFGSLGRDVSWPNCGTTLPSAGAFGIVGVTDGRAFTDNPCLVSEYQWATAATSGVASFYLNLNAPIGSTARANTSGPVACASKHDTLCESYNYGWNAAGDAYAYARSTLGIVDSTAWWLDVETGNSWSTDTAANAQVVQGALDFFAGAYGSSVNLPAGVYSAPSMWTSIVGAYLPQAPVWYATAVAESSASGLCGTSFTAGPVWLVQYSDGSGIDADFSC